MNNIASYHVEKLLKNDKIICHEIRSTQFNNNDVLLHFFLTESKEDANALPKFKMGYERYRLPNETEKNIKSTDELIENFYLVENSSHPNMLFNNNPLTPSNTDLINISAMIDKNYKSHDNSFLYRKNKLINEMYNDNNDFNIQPSKTMREIAKNEKRTSHSLWRSPIHFDTFDKCSNEELYELFKKYKPYIGKEITGELNTESKMNIDMESIFGAAFDLLRIKTKIFHHDDHDDYSGQEQLV